MRKSDMQITERKKDRELKNDKENGGEENRWTDLKKKEKRK